MCHKLYKCRNCTSTSKEHKSKCPTCGMKGMLVEVPSTVPEAKPTIKKIFTSCKNCGTTEMGAGTKCKKCHFPIEQLTKPNLTNNTSKAISS